MEATDSSEELVSSRKTNTISRYDLQNLFPPNYNIVVYPLY